MGEVKSQEAPTSSGEMVADQGPGAPVHVPLVSMEEQHRALHIGYRCMPSAMKVTVSLALKEERAVENGHGVEGDISLTAATGSG